MGDDCKVRVQEIMDPYTRCGRSVVCCARVAKV